MHTTCVLVNHFNAPALHLPMGQSSDGAHLPNERIRIQNLTNGQVCVCVCLSVCVCVCVPVCLRVSV